ncbi:MAG: hypothetical protein RR311_01360 [Comamonas sp.]
MTVNFNAAVQVTAASIQGMDLETAMMAVQSNRANLLETQLKDQIASVQAKNDQVSSLNTMLGQLNALAAKFKSDASSTTTLKSQNESSMLATTAFSKTLAQSFAGAGFNSLDVLPSGKTGVSGFDLNIVKKADIEGAIATVKGNIDSLSNTQQMDMLRLQSMSNKRNEAFDVMSNFIKKMQDSRSSILGNMR